MFTCQDLKTHGTAAIVGAGPAGTTLARLLQLRGFTVRVFERDASPTARPQGGSLDLRRDAGQRAVDAAGLADAFARASRPEATAFKMLDEHGNPHPFGEAGTHEEAGPEIDRGDLRQLLLDALAPGTVAWDHRVDAIRPESDGRWRLDFDGRPSVVADLVVGADGVGSKVRGLLTPVRPRHIGITMLAAVVRKDLWRGSQLATMLGEGSMMFAGGQKTIFVQRCARDLILLYYSLTVAEDWPTSAGFGLEDREAVSKAIAAEYADWPPGVMSMLTQTDGPVHRWPLSVMPPDHRWETRPGLTMIGDSSHAMPPFTGKGVNLAMLDALELADGLTTDPTTTVAAAVGAFEADMQARTREEISACLEVGRNLYGVTVDFGTPTPSTRDAR